MNLSDILNGTSPLGDQRWDFEAFGLAVYGRLCGPDSSGFGVCLDELLSNVTAARLRDLHQLEPGDGEVLCDLGGHAAFEAIVAREVELIRFQAAERITDATRARYKAAESALKSELSVTCGVDLDDVKGDVSINQKLGQIFIVDPNQGFTSLLEATRRRIAGEEVDLPAVGNIKIADLQDDLDAIRAKLDKEELLDLLDNLVRDKDFASTVAADDEVAAPIRFLADVARKVNNFVLPQAPRAMGFGGAVGRAG